MRYILFFFATTLLYPCNTSSTTPQLKVMSFNIRYGTAQDGENSWEKRKHTVIERIKQTDADIIGLQEVLYFQWQELEQHLGDKYLFVGKTRQANNQDEAAVNLVKKAHWKLLKMDYYWLSETPKISGSMSWNTVCPRICVAVYLEHKSTGKQLVFANTHYSHVSDDARNRSSNMIRYHFRKEIETTPFILVGDLNAQPHEQAIDNIFKDKTLFDTHATLDPKQADTFYGWKDHTDSTGIRIDYIISNKFLKKVGAKVLDSKIDGRHPSDHNAIMTEFEW